MPATQLSYRVEMEDGDTWDVVADQRDLAEYELQEFYDVTRPVVTARYLGWRASMRQGKTKLSWPQFREKCLEVGATPKAGAAAGDVDPTQPAASAGGS